MDRSDRLLLVRCSLPGTEDDGRWTLPGGAMEWGESPEQTALRELKEESGLSAKLGSICGVFSRWYTAEEAFSGEPGHVIGIIFDADEPMGDLRVEAAGSTTDDVRWFERTDALTLPSVELLSFALGLDRGRRPDD